MAFIVNCYQTLLGRLPDIEGLMAVLASAADEVAIRDAFLNSPERQRIDVVVSEVQDRISASGTRRNYLLMSAFGNGNLGDRSFPRLLASYLERDKSVTIFAYSVIEAADYVFPKERKLHSRHHPTNSLIMSLFDGLLLGPGGLLAWPHPPVWEPQWPYSIPIPYAIFASGVETPLSPHLNNLVRMARSASGRDDLSVAALSAQNLNSFLCPDPILSLYNPRRRSCGQGAGRAFIVRGPLRPEHHDLAGMLTETDAVFGLEIGVDWPLLEVFPTIQFFNDLDALCDALCSRELVVSERYHGAIAALLLGRKVHGWIRLDHNSAKLTELFRVFGIGNFCGEALQAEPVAHFPSETIAARLAEIRMDFSRGVERMLSEMELVD